jgi:hypothetical protein
MHDDRFQTLIERADRAVPPPGCAAAELSSKVKMFHHKRQRRRMLAAATSMAFLCIVAVRIALPHLNGIYKTTVDGAASASAQEIAALKDKLAQLQDKIQLQEKTIDRLLEAERSKQLQAEADRLLLKLTGRELIDRQASQTAATLLVCADEESKIPAFREYAATSYNQVIISYPQTPWAEEAKQRLDDMQERGN